ncbi:MAG: hypothetical protein ACOYEV_01370 [Candidatus Nanopelagicales bacterium]
MKTAVGFPIWTQLPGTSASAAKVRQLGATWADRGCPPVATYPLEVAASGAKTVVFLAHASDLGSGRPGPRLYLAADFLGGALAAAEDPAGRARVRSHLAETAWGALTLLAEDRAPARIDSVRAAITGLLAHWPALASLGYVDAMARPVPLEEAVALHLGGLLAMWVDQAGPDLPSDLATAGRRLAGADGSERERRTLARLAELAATNARITHRSELSDPARLWPIVSGLADAERESLAAGDTTFALTLLYGTDRYL